METQKTKQIIKVGDRVRYIGPAISLYGDKTYIVQNIIPEKGIMNVRDASCPELGPCNCIEDYELQTRQEINVGDIVYNSWGYDQTNIDFYKVVGRTKTMVKLRLLKDETTENGFMCGTKIPTKDFASDKVFRKKINYYHSEVTIYFEYGCGSVWDGQPKSCSWYA